MASISAGASKLLVSTSASTSTSENSPLLPPTEVSSPSSTKPPSWKQRLAQHVRIWKVVYLCGLFILIIDCGENLRVVPELRLLELAVCRKYYLKHDPRLVDLNGDVEEAYCKLDVLQSQLAMVRGWLALLKGVIQVLTVIPFGVLADTRGRKLVLALSQTGLVLSEVWILTVCYFYANFSVEAVLVSALFLVLGGGSSVLNAMVFAMLADAVIPDRRTKAFFYVSTANLVVELLAPPLGALILMKTTLYNALITGLLIESSGLLVILIIPETLAMEPPLERVSILDSHGSRTPQDDRSAQNNHYRVTVKRLKELVQYTIRRVKNIRDLVLTDCNVYLALPAFLVNRLPRQLMAVLLQYASKRLGWTFAKTSILISARPIVTIVLYCLLVPTINDFLSKKLHFSSAKANLVLAKWSCIALIFGCLIMSCVRTLVPLIIGLIIFALGWGFSNNVQLFVTSRVEKDQVATLYTALSVVDALGGLAGAPILAISFSAGLSLSGFWSGLPFFVAGGIYALAGSGLLTLGSGIR